MVLVGGAVCGIGLATSWSTLSSVGTFEAWFVWPWCPVEMFWLAGTGFCSLPVGWREIPCGSSSLPDLGESPGPDRSASSVNGEGRLGVTASSGKVQSR